MYVVLLKKETTKKIIFHGIFFYYYFREFAYKLSLALIANPHTPLHTLDLSNNLIEDKGNILIYFVFSILFILFIFYVFLTFSFFNKNIFSNVNQNLFCWFLFIKFLFTRNVIFEK